MELVFGIDQNGDGVVASDRVDFLNSTGAWANQANGVTTTGVDAIDFWIGGLAEAQMPFGGLLGSSFNFVFETQLENLQNGDRFYYLARTAGLNFITELEDASFAKLIMRNTDATHLPADVFSTPTFILEVDQTKQFNANVFAPGTDGVLGTTDDVATPNADPTGTSIFNPLVIRGPGFLQYTGEDHVVLGGTEGNDTIIAGIGDVRSGATAAMTGSRVATASTTSKPEPATTSSPISAATTSSRATTATT
jgi:hypothetical protein